MALYTIGDLHLSLGDDKPMDIFPGWEGYVERILEGFSGITDEDTVVLAGDSSWGMGIEGSLEDMRFINALPGKKLLLKGNHDYWWGTASRMKRFFAENGLTKLDILHNNCFFYGDIALCGTRGWSYEEDFGDAHDEKVFKRELLRLRASFEAAGDREKICFLHYPPKYKNYEVPEILEMLREFGVKRCYYGHLHGPSHRLAMQGEFDGVEYRLISADYIGFKPWKITD